MDRFALPKMERLFLFGQPRPTRINMNFLVDNAPQMHLNTAFAAIEKSEMLKKFGYEISEELSVESNQGIEIEPGGITV